MRDRIDPNENSFMLKEGEYLFEIYEVSSRVKTAKSHYRTWKFNTVINGETEQIWINYFPFTVGELLLVLGYEQDKNGYFDWDDEEVIGKKFIAKLTYELVEGKNYPRLSNFKSVETSSEEIPF